MLRKAHISVSGKSTHLTLALHLGDMKWIPYGSGSAALDAYPDPDLPKLCQSYQVRIHNTAFDLLRYNIVFRFFRPDFVLPINVFVQLVLTKI